MRQTEIRPGMCPACQIERSGRRVPFLVPHICSRGQSGPRRAIELYIGIDTGTKTGIALYAPRTRQLEAVQTVKIHQAMEVVRSTFQDQGRAVFVRVEDARLRKWIPKDRGREVLQGAGSVKRDASIWDDFLTDLHIPHEMVAPKANKTKVSAEYFKTITGWQGKTSNHGRDAALLVFGL